MIGDVHRKFRESRQKPNSVYAELAEPFIAYIPRELERRTCEGIDNLVKSYDGTNMAEISKEIVLSASTYPAFTGKIDEGLRDADSYLKFVKVSAPPEVEGAAALEQMKESTMMWLALFTLEKIIGANRRGKYEARQLRNLIESANGRITRIKEIGMETNEEWAEAYPQSAARLKCAALGIVFEWHNELAFWSLEQKARGNAQTFRLDISKKVDDLALSSCGKSWKNALPADIAQNLEKGAKEMLGSFAENLKKVEWQSELEKALPGFIDMQARQFAKMFTMYGKFYGSISGSEAESAMELVDMLADLAINDAQFAKVSVVGGMLMQIEGERAKAKLEITRLARENELLGADKTAETEKITSTAAANFWIIYCLAYEKGLWAGTSGGNLFEQLSASPHVN